ncbi:MAG TPA: hypothetical protein VF701_09045 [Thermoanaerobaculia bacterium]
MTHRSALVFSILLSIATVAMASPAIDQEQVNIDRRVTLAVGGASEQKLAQVFKAGRDGYLRHVTFPLSCLPYAIVTVSLQKVADGLPSGVVLASEAVSGYLYPTIYPAPGIAFRIVEFATPAHIYAGEEYAVVLEASGDTCNVWSAPAGDSYLSGRAYFDARPNAPGWVRLDNEDPSGSDDLPFQLFVDDKPSACKSGEKR